MQKEMCNNVKYLLTNMIIEESNIIPFCIKKGNGGIFSRGLLRSIFVNLCDSADVSSSSLLCNCFICSRKFPIRILFALSLSSSICTESNKMRSITYFCFPFPSRCF